MGAPKTQDGRPRYVLEKGTASKLNFFTHDWSDPTTWYSKSILVTDEVAVDSGDHQVYKLAHKNVIDTYHSKVYQEDYLKDAAGQSFRVTVKVNNVVWLEEDPHFGPDGDGDFTVDYVKGEIHFVEPINPAHQVKVTYHYASGSGFVIAPTPGKQLSIDMVEVQFSDDIVLTDSVVFQPYGYVEAFAPQLCTANGGPYPPGTKIPLGNPLKYKSFTDFQAEATKAYTQYPAMGGENWRAAPHKITIMNWDYLSSTLLKASQGMEIRVFLEHDTPFQG